MQPAYQLQEENDVIMFKFRINRDTLGLKLYLLSVITRLS